MQHCAAPALAPMHPASISHLTPGNCAEWARNCCLIVEACKCGAEYSGTSGNGKKKFKRHQGMCKMGKDESKIGLPYNTRHKVGSK